MDTQTETSETEAPDVEPVEATEDVQVPADVDKTPVERPVSDRQSRKAKRLDVEAAERRAQEFQQTLERERAEGVRRDREIAEMRGRLEERQRQTQTQDKHAETKSKIADLRKQAKAHLFFSSQAKDQAAAEKEWDDHQRLTDEANRLMWKMDSESEWENRRGEFSQQIPDQGMLQERNYIATKYPWVESSIEGRSLADGKYTALVNGGSPQGRQTMEVALTWAAKTLGLGGNGAGPSDHQRRLYSGVPGGEGAGGGGDGAKTIRVGRHEEAMAKAAYPHLEAKDAVKQWAKDVSARINQSDD